MVECTMKDIFNVGSIMVIVNLIGVSLHKRREEKKYQQEKVIGQEG